MADLVVSLAYGIQGHQSGKMLRQYKDDPSGDAMAQHRAVMQRMLFLGLIHHEACVGKGVGLPVNLRVCVPSLSGRVGPHPFEVICDNMNATGDNVRLRVAPGASAAREVRGDLFEVFPEGAARGQHMLVLDDTWTTGSRAQSAAIALRRGGAKAVTVMTIGRWITPGFAEHIRTFVNSKLTTDYEPLRCPVTGGDCP
ncbi:MAG: amidophosphoribosyltransferase [Rhodococcus sp. (in: high G+C Gram-positive bacteria)]